MLLFVLEAQFNGSFLKSGRHNLIVVLRAQRLKRGRLAFSELWTFYHPWKAKIWLRLGGDDVFICLGHTTDFSSASSTDDRKAFLPLR